MYTLSKPVRSGRCGIHVKMSVLRCGRERSDGPCSRAVGATLPERIAGGGRRRWHLGQQPVTGSDGGRSRCRRGQRRSESRHTHGHHYHGHGLRQTCSGRIRTTSADRDGATTASPAGQIVSQPATAALERAPKLLTKLAYLHNTTQHGTAKGKNGSINLLHLRR